MKPTNGLGENNRPSDYDLKGDCRLELVCE